jgi:hypothetical protein
MVLLKLHTKEDLLQQYLLQVVSVVATTNQIWVVNATPKFYPTLSFVTIIIMQYMVNKHCTIEGLKMIKQNISITPTNSSF